MAEKIRKLTAAEEAASCARFYDAPVAPLSEEVLHAFAEPMDPAQAILPERINDIFGSAGAANGYCMIPCEGAPDGGYATVTTLFPGATLDMLYWWFAWRGLESVNYTVSDPYQNHSVGMNDRQIESVRTSQIPLEAKSRGIIQSLVKDAGRCGLEDFVTHLNRPEDMAVKRDSLADRSLGFVGGWWMREDRKSNDPLKKAVDMFAHVLLQEEDGVRVRSFIWCGYRGIRGRNLRRAAYGPVIDETYARQIGLSVAHEMAQLASILPELYASQEGKF